jgi:CHAT domain-containing protein
MYDDVLVALSTDVPTFLHNSDLSLQKEILEAAANAHLHRFSQAQEKLNSVQQRCIEPRNSVCSELLNVQGLLEVEQGRYAKARPFYEGSLRLAQRNADGFAEASALLKLSQVDLLEEHFDQAIDRSDQAIKAAERIGAKGILSGAQGNSGWAFYKTGDSDRALLLYHDAGVTAHELGVTVDEVRWLTASGYVYIEQGRFSVAEELYGKALNIATKINSKEDILNAQISLAFVSLLTNKLDLARQYSDEAIASARADGNRVDELYPLLTQAQALVRQGDPRQPAQIFSEIANDPKVDPSLKWEAEHELANFYADLHQSNQAETAYRTALTTFETARAEIQHEGVKLPFLSNASTLYEDYVRFLLSRGKTADALSVADHARARSLAEGLGQLSKTDAVVPTKRNAQATALRAGGPILYYLLGVKQSYLWAITPQKISFFELPPEATIDATVHRYRKALETPKDLAESQNPDGLALYQMLVAPALPMLGKTARVFIIPDGSLNALNFEALLAPDPMPHYWIEDVTLANASSLRLLERASHSSRTDKGKMLLVGNPMAASPEFGTLPQAALEIENIRKRFPASDQQVLAEAAATPAAYLAGKPEQFAYIHFVAHGTASRLSPLDSAIVLSKSTPADDAFRLYARDIIHSPLRAELVTVSSCYGAGSRAYSGEGLVGLSWAFLRAGAHNVIGALWDVSDASTPRLMDEMYAAIQKGKPPAEALRQAKLSLLHSNDSFRRPFYWAPFQFYTGS